MASEPTTARQLAERGAELLSSLEAKRVAAIEADRAAQSARFATADVEAVVTELLGLVGGIARRDRILLIARHVMAREAAARADEREKAPKWEDEQVARLDGDSRRWRAFRAAHRASAAHLREGGGK